MPRAGFADVGQRQQAGRAALDIRVQQLLSVEVGFDTASGPCLIASDDEDVKAARGHGRASRAGSVLKFQLALKSEVVRQCRGRDSRQAQYPEAFHEKPGRARFEPLGGSVLHRAKSTASVVDKY